MMLKIAKIWLGFLLFLLTAFALVTIGVFLVQMWDEPRLLFVPVIFGLIGFTMYCNYLVRREDEKGN